MFTTIPNSGKIKRKVIRFLRAMLAGILSVQYFLLFCVVGLSANPNQGIQVDRSRGANTRVHGKAGRAVIDISTPSNAGVSRNAYSHFNVGSSGAVFNNSQRGGRSQLAGRLEANTNLEEGVARVILNEVTGGSRSDLRGGIEIFGQRAEFILANSYGINCDGCGFMNMSRATLTTGQVRLDKDGLIDGFDVEGGDVHIGSQGLDASGVDYFDLVTEKTRMDGLVKAKSFAAMLGHNRVSYNSRDVEEELGIAGVGDGYALDIAKLGGVNADSIYMKSTDKGMGVRVAGNMAASAGSITFRADGKMDLGGNVSAKRGGVVLESRSSAISIDQFARISGDSISMEAGNAIVNEGGFVEASKHLYLRAGDQELLQSSLEDADFVPSEEGDGPRGIINKKGGVLRSWGVGQLKSQWGIANEDSEILANGWLELSAGQGIANSGGALSAGIGYVLLNARDNIESKDWGRIEGVMGARLDSKFGDIKNKSAHMFGGHSLQLSSGNDVVNDGKWATIKSVKSVSVLAGRDISINAGLVAAGEDIILQAGRDLQIGQDAALKAVRQIYAVADHEIRNEGLLLSGGRIDLIAETGDVFNNGRIEVGEVDILSILLEKYGGDGLIPRDAKELQHLLSLSPNAVKSSYTVEEIEELFAIVRPEGYEEEEEGAKLLVIRSGGGDIKNLGEILADFIILEAKENLLNSGLIEAESSISLYAGSEIKELGNGKNIEIIAKVDEILQSLAPPSKGGVAASHSRSATVQNTGDVLQAVNDAIDDLAAPLKKIEEGDASSVPAGLTKEALLSDLESLRAQKSDILEAEVGEDDERVILSSGSLFNEGTLIADRISMRVVGEYAEWNGGAVLNSGSVRNTATGSIIARLSGESPAGGPESEGAPGAGGGGEGHQGPARPGSGAVIDIDADGSVYNLGYISAGALMSIRSRNGSVVNAGKSVWAIDYRKVASVGENVFGEGRIEGESGIIISAGEEVLNTQGGHIKAGASLRIEAEDMITNQGEATLSASYIALISKNSYIANLRGGRIEGRDGVSLSAKAGIINTDFNMLSLEGWTQEEFDARLDSLRGAYGEEGVSTIASSAGTVVLRSAFGSIDNSAGAIVGKSVYLDSLGDKLGKSGGRPLMISSVDGAQGIINRRGGLIQAEETLSIRTGAGDLADQDQKERIFVDAAQSLDSLYAALDAMGIDKEELGISFSEDAYSADVKGALMSVLRILENWRGRKSLEAGVSGGKGASGSASLSLEKALLLEAGFEAGGAPLAGSENPCAGQRDSSISGVLCGTVAKMKELYKEASEADYTVLQSGSVYNESGSMLSGSSIYISNQSSVDDIGTSGILNVGGRIEGSEEGFTQIISQGKIDATKGSISGGDLYLQAKGDILYGASRIVAANSKSLQLIAGGGLYGTSNSPSLISGGQVVLQAKQDVLGNNAQIKAAADRLLFIGSDEGRVELGDSELAGGDISIVAKGAADLGGSSVHALSPEGNVSLRSSEGDVSLDNGSVSGAQIYLQAERGSLSNVGGEIRASQFAVLISGAASEKLMGDEDKRGIFTRVSQSLGTLRESLSEVNRTTFNLRSVEPGEGRFTANVSGNISSYLSILRDLALNEDLDESQRQAIGVAIEQLLDARSATDAYGHAGLLDNTGGLIASEGALHVMIHAGQKADGSIEGARILLDRGSLSASSDELFSLKVEGNIDLGHNSSISAGALNIQARTQTGGLGAELIARASREQLAAIYASLYGLEPEDLLGEEGAPDRVPLGLRLSVSDGGMSVYGEKARIEGDGVSLSVLSGAINVGGAVLGRADSRTLSLVAKDDLRLSGASFSSDSISVKSLTGNVLGSGEEGIGAKFSAKNFVSIKAAGDIGLGHSALLSEAIFMDADGDIKAVAMNVRASPNSYFRAIAGGAIDIREADLVIGSGSIHARGGDLLMSGENASLLALSSQGSLELRAGFRGYLDAERYTEIFKGLEDASEDEQVSILSLLSALDGKFGISIDHPSQSDDSSQKEGELTIRIALGNDEKSGEAIFTESSFREDAEAFFSRLLGVLSSKAQAHQVAAAIPEEEEAEQEEVPEEADSGEGEYGSSSYDSYLDTEEAEEADPLSAAIGATLKGLQELQKTLDVVEAGKIGLSGATVSGNVSVFMESIGHKEGIVADRVHISTSPAQSVRLVSGGGVV